jgi:hypothetical protein
LRLTFSLTLGGMTSTSSGPLHFFGDHPKD